MKRKLVQAMAIAISGFMLFTNAGVTALAEGLSEEIVTQENTSEDEEVEVSEEESEISENFEDDSESEETTESVSEISSEEDSEVCSEEGSEETSEISLEEGSEAVSEVCSEEDSEEDSEVYTEEDSEEQSEEPLEEEPEMESESTLEEVDGYSFSDTDIAHGKYENVTWLIDKNGRLRVYGTGEVSPTEIRFYHDNTANTTVCNVPWFEYRKQIKSAEINLKNCTSAAGFFYECSNMVGADLTNFDTSELVTMNSMFYSCKSLIQLDVSKFNTSKVQSMNRMFYRCENLTTLDVSRFDTKNVVDMAYMFYGCAKLTTVDVSHFDTSMVKDMKGMFSCSYKLKTINVGNFNTSNVENMSSMFESCFELSQLNVSGFNTSNVTNMGNMFYNCQKIQVLDVSGFDTSWVWNMTGMFGRCYNLKRVDTSNFKTSNVMSMDYMFEECRKLTTIDVSGFETAKVYTMYSMFSGCKSLKSIDVSNFNTSDVEQMTYMFKGCETLSELDLSNFDTSKITRMSEMFYNCKNLKSINVTSFDTRKVTQLENMFRGCDKLESLDLSSFDLSSIKNDESTDGMDGFIANCPCLVAVKVPMNLNKSYPVSCYGNYYGMWYNSDTGAESLNFPTDVSNSFWISREKTRKIYEITYNYDGGNKVPANVSNYLEGKSVSLKAPTKAGYTFAGWYNTENDVKVTSVSGRNISLYAKWVPINYKITYVTNSGIFEAGAQKPTNFTIESKKILLPDATTFTRNGYYFQGWYEDSLFTKPVSSIEKGTIGNKTFYAKWTVNSYTVIFRPNCETDQYYPGMILTYNQKFTIPQGVFNTFAELNPGYVVDSFNTMPDGTGKKYTKEILNATSEYDGTVHLYAQWKKGYTISYDEKGGNNTANATTYKEGSTYKLLAPTKDYYKFAGWYDVETDKLVTSVKNRDICVYAKWNPIAYKITYKTNSGTFDKTIVKPTKYTVLDETITLPTPERKYYIFKGWFLDSKFTQPISSIEAGSNGNITLYAKWEGQSYTIRAYTGNGEENYIFSYKYGEKKAAPVLPVSFEDLGRQGQYIKSWTATINGKTKTFAPTAMLLNVTTENGGCVEFRPVWEDITYTVKYNANGGKGSMAAQTVKGSANITLRTSTFTKTGFVQTGWVDDKGCYYSLAETTQNMTEQNKGVVTLKAVWMEVY